MQIKTQLSCTASLPSENVVQKIFAPSDTRQNEICHATAVAGPPTQSPSIPTFKGDEFLYVQVSSTCIHHHHQERKFFEWSLCPIDKIQIPKCWQLIKYLIVNWFFIFVKYLCKCPTRPPSCCDALVYRVHRLHSAHKNASIEHEKLMCDKNLILLLHSTTHFESTAHFYMRFYKILLHLFYDAFNNNQRHHQQRQQSRPESDKNRVHSHTFCDLSTNSKHSNIFFVINELNGIESHRCAIDIAHIKFKHYARTLNLLYGILLIQRHLVCGNDSNSCNDHYEFSWNVKHHILLQLLAHNQIILHVTSTWYYQQHHPPIELQMPWLRDNDKSPHNEIENCIATLATSSNHKLKQAQEQKENDTCHHHSQHHNHNHHQPHEKYTNCSQQFYRTFRPNDSVKCHLNAILFLIILCIPLLTSAASVHNLKYSSNVVKTKYGPLRGIILRSQPTVEGYLGVPYGK